MLSRGLRGGDGTLVDPKGDRRLAHLVASNGTLSVQVRTSILSEYIRMHSIEIGSIINNSRGREFSKSPDTCLDESLKRTP